MVEVLKLHSVPDTEGDTTPALLRSSTVSVLPADSDNNTNFTPSLLKSSQTAPVEGASQKASSVGHKHGQRSPPIAQGSHAGRLSQIHLDTSAESSAIDPLSQHIFKRTNTERSIPAKLLGRASQEAGARGNDRRSQDEFGPTRGDSASHHWPQKEKRKGISFLSRIIPGKKKDLLYDAEDDASEPDSDRTDTDLAVQPLGFIPRLPRPPKYLRVKAYYKKDKIFNRVFVAQELEDMTDVSDPSDKPSSAASSDIGQHDKADGKAVWAMGFSNDGKYLATAGQDKKVRVWAVISSVEDRGSLELEGDDVQDSEPFLKAPAFKTKPAQVYGGHTGSILDLSWSKNNFLLSSSMDKTVRLWHVTRAECLCCFKHSDFVTSIQFHPRDDRFFLAGSLDTKVRLWSIPDKSMAFVTTAPDMVTAVAFTPDGQYSIAGCLNGVCSIYETDGLKASGQINVRSARGRNAKGSKITGIDTITMPADSSHNETRLLITSNDSRIRLYNFRDRTLLAKFRGNENTCSQIRASFSDDGKHVICGSEDRKTYIWPVSHMEKDSDKRAVDVFDTRSPMVTAAVIAPMKTKQILGYSEDPIYDICNPLPVSLGDQPSSAPAGTQRFGITNGEGRETRNFRAVKLAQESPKYLARSAHPNGNIIVVADYSGKIKVLRQDCAYEKRRNIVWDASATASKRRTGRTNSTRRSVSSSIGRESQQRTPSERIISWRNSVIGHELGIRGSPVQSPAPSLRSSPGRNSFGGQLEPRPQVMLSPPPSPYKSSMESGRSGKEMTQQNTISPGPTRRPQSSTALVASGVDKENPLWLQGDQSYAYWNKITRDALAANSRKTGRLLSPSRVQSAERQLSVGSILGSPLSSDYASSMGDGDDGEILKCDNCRGTNFQSSKGRNGKQRLMCVGCRRPVT